MIGASSRKARSKAMPIAQSGLPKYDPLMAQKAVAQMQTGKPQRSMIGAAAPQQQSGFRLDSDALMTIGAGLRDLDWTVGSGNDLMAQTQAIQQRKQGERADKYNQKRDAVADSRYATQQAYGEKRDAVSDARFADDRAYGRGRDQLNDERYGLEAKERQRSALDTQAYRDQVFDRGVMESDRAHDLDVQALNIRRQQTSAVRYLSEQEKAQAGYDPEDIVQRAPDGADRVVSRATPEYSQGERSGYRERGAMLIDFQTALENYANEVNQNGVSRSPIPTERTALLNAQRQELLFAGKNLYDLGVLSRDDYENMANAIPDATKDWTGDLLTGDVFTGRDTFNSSITPLRDSIDRQINAIPEQFRPERNMQIPSHDQAVAQGSAEQARMPHPDFPYIPTGAIEVLRQNPDMAADFDAKYGAGSANAVLGNAGQGTVLQQNHWQGPVP